jgi:3-hydroxyacyl-CoA dehydrogenase
MGAGIAMNFANAGIPVTILETKQDALDKGLAGIRAVYERSVAKGKLTADKLAQRMASITGTLSYDALAQADIVVEAVFEDMDVKELVFRELDKLMKPGAILATNTSSLDVNRIAAFTGRPQDVIGLHFFSPAHVMKLLEIVRGAQTAPDVLVTALALAKKLKKTGVVSGVCDGFIGNRMLEQYLRQAYDLLEEGALPEQVDRAIEAFGFAMGPFRMSDLAGNDIGWHIRKRRAIESPDFAYSKLPDLLCEQGRFGQKTGAGWYDYQAGARAATPSGTVDAMVTQYSGEIGVARRAIADAEIVERLVYALVNEGAKILEEGIALRASDIDMVYLSGYGFPLHRGGPMLYADMVGLPAVLAAIEGFARGRNGEAWTPAPLLVRLAAANGAFNA